MGPAKIVRRFYRPTMRQVHDIPLLRVLCLAGVHSRSRRHVYRDNKTTYSECRWCQARMARVEGGDWRVVDPGDPVDLIGEDTKR